jgi:hypothetical protein
MTMCVINLKMPSDLCLRLCSLCAFLWLFTVTVEAQNVTLQGKVSETVALSVAPNSIQGETAVSVMSDGSTVRMTLSGSGANSPIIRVPLMVRSNTSFKISGMFESTTAQLNQLSVMDARATGRLVSTEAVNNLERSELSDLEHGPFVILSGPRVSTGGTLNSPTNALQITLLLRIKPQSTGNWLAQLTFLNH